MKNTWIVMALALAGCATTGPRPPRDANPGLVKLLESLAGPSAVLCGYVHENSDAVEGAQACAKTAYEAGKPFTFAFGSDATAWTAYAGNAKGQVTQVYSFGGKYMSTPCARFEVTEKLTLHCSI